MQWFKKFAKKEGSIERGETAENTDSQQADTLKDGFEFHEENFGDIQRYGLDGQSIKISYNKTDFKITVSVNQFSWMSGVTMYSEFWTFPIKEEKRAEKCYLKVKKTCEDLLRAYRKVERPINFVYTELRNRFNKIEPDRLNKSGVWMYNSARKYDYEEDWRTSLYGNRYKRDIEDYKVP